MKQLRTSFLRTNFWLAALPLGLTLNGGFAPNALAQEVPKAADTPAAAAATEDVKTLEFPQGILFPYSLLDSALIGNVDKDGQVDYLALKNHQGLKLFLQAVATADVSKFPVLTRRTKVTDQLGREEEKESEDRSAELVFWINAYNALVLNTISEAYPINTPDNIPDFDTAKTHRVAGKDYSFAELRKKIVAMEPRAFFALTDGTQGGPQLNPTAYRLVGLDTVLDQNVGYFVSNPNNVALLVINKSVTLNPLFQEADALFSAKGASKKWAGIRRLLTDYSIIGSNKRYFTNNTDVEIKFAKAKRELNRKASLSPVSGQ